MTSTERSPVNSELDEKTAEKLEEPYEAPVVDPSAQDKFPNQTALLQSHNKSSGRLRNAHVDTDGETRSGVQDNGDDEHENTDAAGETDEHEVVFDGDTDPMSPKNRSTLQKWFIVLILSSSSVCVTCASALYTSAYRQMEADFRISPEAATVGLATFVCG